MGCRWGPTPLRSTGRSHFLQAGVTASLTLLDHSLLHASFDRVLMNISLFAALLNVRDSGRQ